MPTFLRAFVRLSIGLLGAFWCCTGLMILGVGIGEHLGAFVFRGTVTILIGYCVGYCAFVRTPWEETA